ATLPDERALLRAIHPLRPARRRPSSSGGDVPERATPREFPARERSPDALFLDEADLPDIRQRAGWHARSCPLPASSRRSSIPPASSRRSSIPPGRPSQRLPDELPEPIRSNG